MIDQINAAHERLKGRVVCTPLLNFPALDAQLGGRVFLKPENLQHTGSFKYRGALNAISTLTQDQLDQGVIAYSSGNHAQAVAKAAADAGAAATIVMPEDAPAIKIRRTHAFGAKVVLYDRETQSREDVAAQHQGAATLIPPFDFAPTMAGQASAAMEALEQLAQRDDGLSFDQALICCGGGGLAVGMGQALKAANPHTHIYGVEPQGFDDFARSLRAGERLTNPHKTGSICDAIITPSPGEMTFPIAQALHMDCVDVDDEQALLAVAYAAQRLRLIVEPGGAVALAAALFGAVEMAGRTTLLTLSGGNIDAAMLTQALALTLPTHWR